MAREDWTLKSEGDDLVWTVERTWLRDLAVTSAGTPALFFSTRPINNNPSTILPNSVATTFWIAPEKLRGWHNPFYRPAEFGVWIQAGAGEQRRRHRAGRLGGAETLSRLAARV